MKPTHILRAFLLAAGSSLLAISSASAQSWDGSSSGAWLDGTNWTGDTAAGSTTSSDTDIAVFNVNANNTIGINMTTAGGNYYLGAIDNTNATARVIQNTSGTTGVLTLNGATVNSVSNTIIRNSTASLLTIGNSGSGTLGLALGNATANVIQITSTGGVTINSNISGSNGITRQGAGAGTLTLAGNNSYTGVTSITGGTLTLGNANALGSTAVGSHTTIAATGTASNGRLNLNGISTAENITITGATEVSGGFNPVTNGSGTLSGTITLDGTNGIRLGAGTTLFSGTITQAIGKTHALVFQGTNTVSNALTINGGALTIYQGTTTLNAASGTGIGSTSIDQGGGLRLGITNAINTGADLNFGTTNTNEFNLASFNQTVRGLSASGGSNTRRVFNSVAATNSILTVGNGGGNYGFNGTILNNTGTGGTVELRKTGAGNQTLSGTNTYTGGTRIDEGTLTLGHSTDTLANTGAVNVNGGTLALGANSDTVGAVTLTSGSITSSTGTLTCTGSAYDVRSGSVSAKLAGSVGLNKTTGGTVTLTGDNSYSGATSITGGTLHIDGTGDINSSSGITVSTGGHFKYNSSTALTSPLTFSGGTISGTNLDGVSFTVGTGQTISPGNSPGTMLVENQTWASGGTYDFEILNATGTAGTDWDLLSGDGTLTISASLGNTFLIDLTSLSSIGPDVAGDVNGFDLDSDYAWKIADFFNPVSGFDVDAFAFNATGFSNTLNGAFGIALGDTVSGGDNSQIYLTYTAIPEPGAALLGSLGLLAMLRRRRA